MVPETTINIKGIREGLLVTLENVTNANLLSVLTTELENKHRFLQGSRILLNVGSLSLQLAEVKSIQQLLDERGLLLWAILTEQHTTRQAAQKLGLATRLPGSQTDLDGNALPVTTFDSHAVITTPSPVVGALLLHETIRSGRSINHEGHVVIIGDVNPGAEIIAGGHIVVWGRLRGLVHAGAWGDETAVICALDLNPTQLRIAEQIAIPPESKSRKHMPEQAAIQDGQIVAEPWQTKSII